MSPRMAYVGDGSEPPPRGLNRAALSQVLAWIGPYRRAIALNCLLTLALVAGELAVPKMLKWTTDEIVSALEGGGRAGQRGGDTATEPAAAADPAAGTFAGRDATWRNLRLLFGGFAAVFLVSMLVRHFEIRRVSVIGQTIMYEVRQRFFAHLHRLSPRYYDKVKAGQIIARGTSDIGALEHVVSWAPNQFVSGGIFMVGAVGLMIEEDGVLFLYVLPILPAAVWLTARFRRRATVVWREVQAQTGRLTANLAESIAGARVIQAFAREERNTEVFYGLTDELYDSRVETARVQGRYMIGMRILTMWAVVSVILIGGYRVSTAAITAGTVVAFLGYVRLFFQPIEQISDLYNQLIYALAGADRILEVLKTEPEIVDRPGAVELKTFEGDVVFDHVTFEYDPGVTVLHDVSLRARPGERIALVGPTGAGKTTICRLIARFYEARQGEVRIDGRDVRSIVQRSLHRRTAIVLQENFLFSGTVMDNIRYGLPGATDAEVIECARRIGSHKAMEALPQGYQTVVGERGESLSAGQRQLVCFTRAMLSDPKILILDEATSAVDTETELAVQEAMAHLTERRTSFIVAHRLSTVRRADRVLVIEGGRVTEEGTHAELVARGGRYAHMYEDFIRSE